MARNGYRVKDDSVTAENTVARSVGKNITKRGEELRQSKAETGMKDMSSSEGAGRAAGVISARYFTAIDPQDVIDERMPTIEVP